jgi:hypothetical protein
LAHVLGSENAIVVTHSHGVTDLGHTHVEQGSPQISGTTHVSSTGDGTAEGATSSSTASSTTGLSINNAGSSGTGANMPPTSYLNIMVKL